MASKRWVVLPDGRVKRWKASGRERFWSVPPHYHRNQLNRRERRRARKAIVRGNAERSPYVHPREAPWFW
jgi:hypothetical protein